MWTHAATALVVGFLGIAAIVATSSARQQALADDRSGSESSTAQEPFAGAAKIEPVDGSAGSPASSRAPSATGSAPPDGASSDRSATDSVVASVAAAAAPARYRLIELLPEASVEVYSSPGGEVIETFGDTTEFGSPRVLSVTEERGRWVGVSTPLQDNGETAWIERDRAEMRFGSTSYSLHADVSERSLELHKGDEVLREMTVAVGAPESPTPTGRFAVTDVITEGLADVYGSGALALSAIQPNPPAGWTGGNRMAVHGTYEPVGQPISAGCIRAKNDNITWLADEVPLGTPIFIEA